MSLEYSENCHRYVNYFTVATHLFDSAVSTFQFSGQKSLLVNERNENIVLIMSSFVPTELHLREVLLHHFIAKKSASEACRLLVDAYGEYAPSNETCDNWFQRFGQNDFNIKDKQHGKPQTTFVDKELQGVLKEDPYQTLQELAASLKVNKTTVSKRLRAMGLVKNKNTGN